MGFLSLSIWMPIVFGVLLLVVVKDNQPGFARALALARRTLQLRRYFAALYQL